MTAAARSDRPEEGRPTVVGTDPDMNVTESQQVGNEPDDDSPEDDGENRPSAVDIEDLP